MAREGTSGKRVVFVLLALAVGAGLIAWLGAKQIESETRTAMEGKDGEAAALLLSEGVIFEAQAGDPGLLIAKDAASGKELWRTELGAVTTTPSITLREELIEVQIAGTPWMTLDRASGEPVE